MKKAKTQIELTKTVRKRPRRPGEIATRRIAIRNFCLECVGYESLEVALCTAPECWLFPWRFGRRPRPAELSK